MKRAAYRLFRAIETASVLVILCVIPTAFVYLLMVWIAGPYRVAALPLAVCVGVLALARLTSLPKP